MPLCDMVALVSLHCKVSESIFDITSSGVDQKRKCDVKTACQSMKKDYFSFLYTDGYRMRELVDLLVE
jgi:hypothetical protein